METSTVLAFGEVLWDLLPDKKTLGGAPLNFAYRLSSLGRRAVPISRLGCDQLGAQAFHAMNRLGLETGWIQWDDDKPTGTVEVTLDAANQPDFRIVPDVAYDTIQWNDELERLAGEAACVCYGTLIQRRPEARRTLEALLEAAPDALRLLDINLRKDCYNEEIVRYSLDGAQALKLNDGEVETLRTMLEMPEAPLPETAAELARVWDLKYVLVTLGENGVFAIGPEGGRCYVPGYKVELVDPIGSGDAFTAGFVHSVLAGGTLREACELGNVLGALVATRAGGTAPVAAEEIEALRTGGGERNVTEDLAEYMD